MKKSPKLPLSFHYITKRLFCQVLILFAAMVTLLLPPQPAFATDVNKFYFESYDADYYITRDDTGRSHLRVQETLTAHFPDTNQNHGIERTIPYASDQGRNLTIPSEQSLNLQLKINGSPTKPNKISKEDGYYLIRIGDAATFVHGRQVYELEYDYENVALAYDSNGATTYDPSSAVSQEIYWDTNGTGWSQKFDSLTVRVHLPDDLRSKLANSISCYVGSYGSRSGLVLTNPTSAHPTEKTIGNGGCDIQRISDGFVFTATDPLPAYHNLTFDLEFQNDTFLITVHKNYTLVIITIVIGLICIAAIILAVRSHLRYSEKRRFYKTAPTPPQYLPAKHLSIGQAARISIKPVKNDKVANLINLAIRHKIELERSEKKKLFGGYSWTIHVKDLTDTSEEERHVLQILNAGEPAVAGSDIIVKTQTYSSAVAACARNYETTVTKSLKSKNLITKEKAATTGINSVLITLFVTVIITIFIFGFLCVLAESLDATGILIGEDYFPLICTALVITTIVTIIILTHDNHIYKYRTEKGLETAVYLDGLRLYMEMAEAERIKFLQSVKGADVSHQGIVNLYEKLLPYAILFGIEESWLSELNRYYEMDDVANPSWCVGNYLLYSDLHAFNTATNRSISSGSTLSDSGGSGSSGFSGGGGGGFSGGGGGGGGGGGW